MTEVAVSTNGKPHSQNLFRAQVVALCKKNFILSRRSKLTICCEIFLPIVVAIAALFIPPYGNSKGNVLETTPAADYPSISGGRLRVGTFSYAESVEMLYSKLNASTSIPYSDLYRQSNLAAVVGSCLCGTMAIGPAGTNQASDFAGYLRDRIRAVDNPRVCDGAPLLTITTAISDPSAYVKSPSYGLDSHPEICYYMNVGRENEVTIMSNASSLAHGDLADYTSYWYAENGDYQHGDPVTNGLEYYNSLQFLPLMGTWMDYRRGSDVPVSALYPMPYPTYNERASGSTMKLLAGFVGALLFTFSAFSVTRKLISERRGRLREGMRIMGLYDFPYNLSWYVWYFVFYLVIAIIVALLSLAILSPFGALWLFLLTFLYFFASMAFVFALSTLFEYPNSGATLSAVIYYILSYALVAVHRETSKWAVSLLPQCAYILVMRNLGQQVFLGLPNTSPTLKFEEFNLIQGLIMLLVDSVLYTLVYLYLDQVVPHEYRSTRSVHFLFTRSFWREMRGQNISDTHEKASEGANSVSSELSDVNEAIERVSGAYQKELKKERATVEINDLKVWFKSVHAVDGLDLTMYRDELFVLLGHNGAGKSTTINALSGMIVPSSGDVSIYGHKVPIEMPLIRRSMGVCPQHDVLWDDLTVEEHFNLFANLRGLSRDEKALKFATEMELGHKFGARVKTLSGGMKRKLSVGLAFVGDSKLVILDEPSSGMDPSARRRMWDFLRSKREGRILCITTHYMDEADVLADRVGIMENGKLTAYGTTSFLKQKFGAGYTLSIAKKDSTTPDDPLIDAVRENTDDPSSVRVRSSAGQELALQVPYSCASSFPKIFEALDNCKSTNQITSYGISISSMEDVFLNVARRSPSRSESATKFPDKTDYDIKLKPSFHQQVRGLLTRRIVYAYRNWVGSLAALLIPMVILLVLLGFQRAASTIGDAAPLTLAASSNPYGAGPSGHIVATWNTSDPFKVDVVTNGQPLPSIDASLPLTDAESSACSLLKPYRAISYDPNALLNSTLNNTLCAGILRFSASLLDKDTAWFEATTLGVTSRFVFADMTALHMTPLSLAGNESLTVVNHPFPHTIGESSGSNQNFAISFSVGGFYAIALTVVAASLLSYMMMEKTLKIKEQLYVSGCGVLPYWTASWVFDFIFTFFSVCLTFIPLQVYKIETYLEADNQAAVWALLVGFCFATPPFNYLISVFARTSTIATYMRIAAAMLGGLVGSFAVSVLFFAAVSPLAGLIIMWILRIFPTYSVAQGLISIFFTGILGSNVYGSDLKPFDSQILRTCHDVTIFDINGSPFEVCMFVAGDDVIMLFVYGAVYFGLLLLIDYMKSDDKWNPDRDLSVPSEKLGVEDERVIAEKDRVSKLDPTTQMIYFKDLKKVFYPGKKNEVWAVRGINYALADGGVFGLLGVNGAGKTTTFRMLCGLIRPSSGHISLIGQPLRGNVHEIRKSIGYCPQENPLLQGLTARDHLYMYARIRGVPSDKIPHHVEDLVKILRLEHYIDKEAVKLSGGNQRKLCAGIALVGHPSIVFLDEPTTGVDPEARRRIWDMIHKIAHDRHKTSAVILTTHSMEEADALCETMVIQANGQFRCLGTSQQIKSDYGRNYRLWIHFREASDDEKEQSLQQLLAYDDITMATIRDGYVTLSDTDLESRLSKLGIEGCRLVDSVLTAGTLDGTLNRTFNRGALASAVVRALQHMKALRWLMINVSSECQTLEEVGEFALPRDLDLGFIFSKLSPAHVQAELEMHDFQLSQTTLEQIFNRIAHDEAHPIQREL